MRYEQNLTARKHVNCMSSFGISYSREDLSNTISNVFIIFAVPHAVLTTLIPNHGLLGRAIWEARPVHSVICQPRPATSTGIPPEWQHTPAPDGATKSALIDILFHTRTLGLLAVSAGRDNSTENAGNNEYREFYSRSIHI